MRRPLSSKAPAVSDLGAAPVAGGANGSHGEAVDCVVGGRQADHVEPVRDRPDELAGLAASSDRKATLRRPWLAEAVGEDGDAWRRAAPSSALATRA